MSTRCIHGYVLQHCDRMGGLLFIRQHEIGITLDYVPE